MKPVEFAPVILYSEDAKAVHNALVSSGNNELAEKVASLAHRSDYDRSLIAGLPYLDENEFSVDDMPIVSTSEIGGYVMVWCWVDKENAEIGSHA